MLGRIIDGAIAPFAPGLAARRMVERVQLEAVRSFDLAKPNRSTRGWDRRSSSADAANARALGRVPASIQDLVRNNKYMASGVRQMVAHAWGDGIAPMALHADAAVAQVAQDGWDRWAEGRVSGLNDWYGHARLCVRGLYVDGESLTVWRPADGRPDNRVVGLESAHLDAGRTEMRADGSRIIQGVEFDRDDQRRAYWLFRDHPGGLVFTASARSESMDARHVDHLFEQDRHGQTRGVSRLAAVGLTLRDIADIEDAKRLQEKVAACVALIREKAEGSGQSPLTGVSELNPNGGPDLQSIRPGMIMDLAAGEKAHSFTPPPSQGGVDFIRQQLAAVSASMVPYHLVTGDVSQANYSSLRAAMMGLWALLDDDQQNIIIPLLCRPAFERQMRRLALETGDMRLLEVRAQWALPVRRHVDPIKDLMAEVLEIRAGLKLLSKALAERGVNGEEHLAQIKAINDLIDQLGLALETDPRRLTDSGVLQAAAGYLAPRQSGQAA